MNSVTIKASKYLPSVTFTIGEIFTTSKMINYYTEKDYVLIVKEITDSQVICETPVSKKIIRITTKNHSSMSKRKSYDFKFIIKQIFYGNLGYTVEV